MAEWLLRGTVNTFFRGSIPLDAYFYYFFFLIVIIIFFTIFFEHGGLINLCSIEKNKIYYNYTVVSKNK
jgi:hypothetical protein